MRPKHIDELKKKFSDKALIIFAVIVIFIVMIMMIYNSMHDGEMVIYNAGIENTIIMNNETIQELGDMYSMLNESFEREIDKLTTGRANRNNKQNKELKHYGVYGKDNGLSFVNDDYENGINIKYVKSERYKSRPDGDSNFKDMLAAMSIIYDQKMDIATVSDMKELFEDMFWLTHTFQYDSTELYPCEYGCDVVKGYKCSDVYDEYSYSNLKYSPFTVRPHDLYEEYSSDVDIEEDEIEVDEKGKRKVIKGKYRDDFNIVYPQGQCSVHNTNGAGCILDKTKLCFHGTLDMYDEEPYDSDCYEVIDVEYATQELPDFAAQLFEEKNKSNEEGEESDGEEEKEYVGKKPEKFLGKIMDRNKTCLNYKIVKYCKETEKLKKINDQIAKEEFEFSKRENPSDSASEAHDKKMEKLEEKKTEIESELAEHLEQCEKDNPDYLCGGFNICLGHGDHYRCDKHNVVVCYGHTSINMNIKILYGLDIVEEFYKVANGE